MAATDSALPQRGDPLSSARDSTPPQSWVQFDNEENPPATPNATVTTSPTALPPPPRRSPTGPAVIDSVQVTLSDTVSRSVSTPVTASNGTAVRQPITKPLSATQPHSPGALSPMSLGSLQTVPLGTGPLQSVPLEDHHSRQTSSSGIRQGYANGDVIVTLLPQNTSLAWVTPAHFRPELVPEELMAQGLTLTVEDYVHVMSQLVNDQRFKLFNICYKRIVIAWILLGFLILLCILFFSRGNQLELFGAGIAWLLLNAVSIFFCMWIKIRLNRGLEKCMAGINLQLMKHKILMGLDDRGKLSCHKVNLCFIYFDTSECLDKLQQLIDEDERMAVAASATADAATTAARASLEQRMDVDNPDIVIAGKTTRRVPREQDRSKLLFAKYSQRWAKDYLRKRLDWAFDALARMEGLAPPTIPRHLSTARCLCQYIENHLGLKDLQRQKDLASRNAGCCGTLRNFFKDVNEL